MFTLHNSECMLMQILYNYVHVVINPFEQMKLHKLYVICC